LIRIQKPKLKLKHPTPQFEKRTRPPEPREGAQFVNGELLVTMRRRADAGAGLGGDPLLFVKPFGGFGGW
jgi:hypothetical protein